jgi:hypothetical protein
VLSLRRADPLSREILPNVVSLCVIWKPQALYGLGSRWAVASEGKNNSTTGI